MTNHLVDVQDNTKLQSAVVGVFNTNTSSAHDESAHTGSTTGTPEAQTGGGSAASESAPFCYGSGTVMMNGFTTRYLYMYVYE